MYILSMNVPLHSIDMYKKYRNRARMFSYIFQSGFWLLCQLHAIARLCLCASSCLCASRFMPLMMMMMMMAALWPFRHGHTVEFGVARTSAISGFVCARAFAIAMRQPHARRRRRRRWPKTTAVDGQKKQTHTKLHNH